jgi:hypothetical protein
MLRDLLADYARERGITAAGTAPTELSGAQK